VCADAVKCVCLVSGCDAQQPMMLCDFWKPGLILVQSCPGLRKPPAQQWAQ
jgi:hypothetical protein